MTGTFQIREQAPVLGCQLPVHLLANVKGGMRGGALECSRKAIGVCAFWLWSGCPVVAVVI